MTKNETQDNFMRRELDLRFAENIELRQKLAMAIEALRPFATPVVGDQEDWHQDYLHAAEVYKELTK